MKKFLMTAVAATLVATPMIATSAEAQQAGKTTTVRQTNHGTVVRSVNHNPRATIVKKTTYGGPAKVTYRRFAKGQRFDRRYAQNYRELDWRNYRGRRLYAPPRGYHWVRSGNDAVLVAITSGLIGAVIAGAILN